MEGSADDGLDPLKDDAPDENTRPGQGSGQDGEEDDRSEPLVSHSGLPAVSGRARPLTS